MLLHLRKGDTLVVTKLDRLARSMRDLLRIIDLTPKDTGGQPGIAMGGLGSQRFPRRSRGRAALAHGLLARM